MKNLLLATALAATPGCMADWTEVSPHNANVAPGADASNWGGGVSGGPDASTAGTDVGQDTKADAAGQDTKSDVGVDTTTDTAPTPPPPVDIPCDATGSVRIQKYGTEYNLYKDVLLDTLCSFYPTSKGWRCIPLNTKVTNDPLSPPVTFGYKSLPSAAPMAMVSYDLFSDAMCLKPMFLTGDKFYTNGKAKPNPKFGFSLAKVNDLITATEAYNLVVPDPSVVRRYWVWDSIKNAPKTCTSSYWAKPGSTDKCSPEDIANGKVQNTDTLYARGPKLTCVIDTFVGGTEAFDTAIMFSSGPATNPKCPGAAGLEIFAVK